MVKFKIPCALSVVSMVYSHKRAKGLLTKLIYMFIYVLEY